MNRNRTIPTVIAAVLLLMPVLYVGSYLALVVPQGIECGYSTPTGLEYGWMHYRLGDAQAERVFWPLEQIDRRLRPGAWETEYEWLGGGMGQRHP